MSDNHECSFDVDVKGRLIHCRDPECRLDNSMREKVIANTRLQARVDKLTEALKLYANPDEWWLSREGRVFSRGNATPWAIAKEALSESNCKDKI